MFKIAKLKKVNNEIVNIKLFTQEKNKYENGKKLFLKLLKLYHLIYLVMIIHYILI